MDTFYLSHGSPMMSIDERIPARAFLQSWREKVLPERPKAILLVSGHWETSDPSVNVVEKNDTIYDFYGFPEPMYKEKRFSIVNNGYGFELKYPAPGSPQLAQKVKELLQGAGFKSVREDGHRGLDHGAWVPLMFMYPDADIPVCQLSIQLNRDAWHHYNMGKALRPLRQEGVLIVGSGSATHNLRVISRDHSAPPPNWALEFDTWLKDALLTGRFEDVNNYLAKAPSAKLAHPWPDHFYPLHVALGAAGEEAKAQLLHHSWTNGTLSYASYRFTSPEPRSTTNTSG